MNCLDRDIFNDKEFFNSDSKSRIVREVYCEQVGYQHELLYNRKKYSELIEFYDRLIKNTVDVVRELSIPNNSISSSIAILKIIREGYLSKDGVFLFRSYGDFLDLVGYEGADITSGRGCCRHLSSFHRAVFDRLGMKDMQIDAIHTTEELSIGDVYERMPNHVVNVIEYNGVLYPFDSSNGLTYSFQNGFVARPLFEEGKTIYFKPVSTMIMFGLSKEEVLRKLTEFNESRRGEQITFEEYYDICNSTINLMYSKESEEVLSEFKDKTKRLIKRISSRLDY